MIHGDADEIVPEPSVAKLVQKLNNQRGIHIDYRVIAKANHYFTEQMPELTDYVEDYLDLALHQRPVSLAMAG